MRENNLDRVISDASKLSLFISGFYHGDKQELADCLARLELICAIAQQLITKRFLERKE